MNDDLILDLHGHGTMFTMIILAFSVVNFRPISPHQSLFYTLSPFKHVVSSIPEMAYMGGGFLNQFCSITDFRFTMMSS
jgi:hypothetical protein